MTTRSGRIARVMLAALAGFLVVSCSAGRGTPAPGPSYGLDPPLAPSPTPLPLPTVITPDDGAPEPDWREYNLPEDMLALALPQTWQKVDAASGMLGGTLQTLSRQHSALADLVDNGRARAAAQSIRFFAFDFAPASVASGFMTNVSLLRQTLSGSVTLEAFAAANVRELEKIAQLSGQVEQEAVQLPVGGTLRLRYQLILQGKNGDPLELYLTQYLLVRGSSAYVLTFATTPPQAEEYAPVFERIGRSLRWLEG